MKRIYLIRHGRQNSTLCNVDVPLAEEGKKQAELLGPRLAGYGIQKIYHSTLIRARETAQILNEFLQIPIQELPFIQEVDFGGFTGKTEEEISEVYGEYKKQRSTHKEDIPYPDGGECGQDVVERAMPVIRKICSEPEEVTAVVTVSSQHNNKTVFVICRNLRCISYYFSTLFVFFQISFNLFCGFQPVILLCI